MTGEKYAEGVGRLTGKKYAERVGRVTGKKYAERVGRLGRAYKMKNKGGED